MRILAILFALIVAQIGNAELPASCSITDVGVAKKACFGSPSAFEYGHQILGDTQEWGWIVLLKSKSVLSHKVVQMIEAPEDHIFEDIAPRFVFVSDKKQPNIMVVESHRTKGARLSLYDIPSGKHLASTPHIGTKFRWLAPIGAADLDRDGNVEVAFVDRPHLAKTLRVFTFKDNRLVEFTSLSGLTNHRIGEDFITGGIRQCESMSRPEMILVDANWKKVMGVTLQESGLVAREISDFNGQRSVRDARRC